MGRGAGHGLQGPCGDHRPLTRPSLEDLDQNEAEGIGGGIYLFEDDDCAQAYLEEHTARLEGFGITDIRAKLLHVNEQLTELNGGPL